MEHNELDLNLAESVVKKAIAGGADEAEVYFTQGYESGVKLRKGKVELLSEAQPKSMSLRLYHNKRAAVVYTSDFGSDALNNLVAKALDLASISDPDPAGGLPDLSDLSREFEQNLETWDPSIGDIPTEIKVEIVRRCEEAAFSLDPRVNNSDGSSFDTYLNQVGLVNSLGFAGSYKSSSCSFGMAALVDDSGGKKQNGWWYSRSNSFKNLEKPEEVGKKAARRAIAKIGGRKVPTQRLPVVFERLAASSLLSTLASTFGGDALERRATFLIPFEKQKLGSDLVSIVDDPLRPALAGTRPFDGEGVASRRNYVFKEGVFEQFLLNTYTARKTGRRTTGNARGHIGTLPGVGTTNLYLESTSVTPEEIIAGVEEGLYLTEMIGFGFNPVTGDFSRGALGMWIENGQLTFPVSEVNIAGNMKEMLANISQVGNDLEFLFNVASPTIRLENLTLSGL